MKWIRIEDCLPEMMDDVLICYHYDNGITVKTAVTQGWLETQPDEDPSFCALQVGNAIRGVENVTHWMPMPLPPCDKDYPVPVVD